MGRSAFCPPIPGGWHGLRCHERPESASGLCVVQTDHPSPAGLMGANESQCGLASDGGFADDRPARGGGPPVWRSAVSRSLEASMDWASSSRTVITVRSLTLNFTQRCPPMWSWPSSTCTTPKIRATTRTRIATLIDSMAPFRFAGQRRPSVATLSMYRRLCQQLEEMTPNRAAFLAIAGVQCADWLPTVGDATSLSEGHAVPRPFQAGRSPACSALPGQTAGRQGTGVSRWRLSCGSGRPPSGRPSSAATGAFPCCSAGAALWGNACGSGSPWAG